MCVYVFVPCAQCGVCRNHREYQITWNVNLQVINFHVCLWKIFGKTSVLNLWATIHSFYIHKDMIYFTSHNFQQCYLYLCKFALLLIDKDFLHIPCINFLFKIFAMWPQSVLDLLLCMLGKFFYLIFIFLKNIYFIWLY